MDRPGCGGLRIWDRVGGGYQINVWVEGRGGGDGIGLRGGGWVFLGYFFLLIATSRWNILSTYPVNSIFFKEWFPKSSVPPLQSEKETQQSRPPLQNSENKLTSPLPPTQLKRLILPPPPFPPQPLQLFKFTPPPKTLIMGLGSCAKKHLLIFCLTETGGGRGSNPTFLSHKWQKWANVWHIFFFVFCDLKKKSYGEI